MGVGVGGEGVDVGEFQAVGQGDGLGVDLCSADDECLGLAGFAGHVEGSLERRGVFGALGLEFGGEGGVAGDDDVTAAGQGPLGEGVEGLAPHDYGVSGGEGLEALKVGGDVEGEVAAAPDGEVASDGGN